MPWYFNQVKEDLAPDLLVNISKLPVQHQEIILRVVVKVSTLLNLSVVVQLNILLLDT